MEKGNIKGLTSQEVNDRIVKNLVNYVDEPKTKTIKEIVKSNVFTYFNFLNIFLGTLVIISGIVSGRILYALKNCLFVGVIFTNTIISIAEEILAKKTIDKLNVIADTKIKTLRNGNVVEISREELVLDDVCIYGIGNQVVTDSVILDGTVEVNESFMTGEAKVLTKKVGDELISGSFIVSGNAYVKVKHIGKDNYISKISSETKYVKKTNSVIYNSFEKMLKILSIALIPVGIIFFVNQLGITNSNIPSSIMSTVSALIGMIPEGLVLLTSSAMAVSVLRLRKYNVLVQDLYSIENLARVDVICLDKTGTITEGTMEVKDIIPYKDNNIDDIKTILSNYVSALDDPSPTFKSIESYLEKMNNYTVVDTLSFSSIRKYSGVKFNEGTYFLGSPENLSKENFDIDKYQNDYRVLLLASGSELNNIDNVVPLGFVLIQDKIKENANVTLDYFKEQGVDIKIISGDNPITVSKIAERAGIQNIKSIDMSKISDEEIPEIIKNHNVLGRVKPDQKKKIIQALKNDNHFVAMTGDGVNDCLALKEADCSIAMANGSEAAKNVSQFVLLDSKIDNLPLILKEGRRSINNIERSSSLLLSKTIFTILLILVCIFMSTEYFFIPIHLTLITMFTIGIPSFVLALEPNTELVKGNFLLKVFLKSIPSAVTVVFNVIIINLFEINFNLSPELCSTLTVFLTATTGFIFLNNICKPYNYLRGALMIFLTLAFSYCAIFQNSFFNIGLVRKDTILVFVVLFICSMYIFDKLKMLTTNILKKTNNI